MENRKSNHLAGELSRVQSLSKRIYLEIEPFSKIKYSTFDPNFGIKDIPENYIHVSYELTAKNGKIQLKITNETFDGNMERMERLNQGWKIVIEKLKEVAEK